jgi:hypothetical protein
MGRLEYKLSTGRCISVANPWRGQKICCAALRNCDTEQQPTIVCEIGIETACTCS